MTTRSKARYRWTVGNLKGGVGKTTTAVSLALALAERTGQRVLLVDADGGQPAATTWADLAGDEWPSSILVTRWPSPTVARRVRDADEAGAVDHLVIDTGPGDPATLRAALSVTDRLVMPIAPTTQDVLQVQPTIDAAAEAAASHRTGLDLTVCLTQVVTGTRSSRDVRAALIERGLDVAETNVPRLEAIANATGETTAHSTYTDLAHDLITRG